ncbi:QueT transporter family protein [Anaerotignum sp. MB30-C6]|uniref:QueT transporter family protein n=1 Tax=Anaerotignum sp. MB30-C6 TaxID=3070814 RepID=UPI0027DE9143|nr:QueT transporter family protein [Anaerotignum sp. MB30-C6]WMI82151.1 QueT transporter family protein [Anaerotignum sp. MB30-C6]
MEKNTGSTRLLVVTAMIAALYAVMTTAIAPLAFGPIQLRISEVLVLLAFIDKRYIPGLILGCFIANLFSPFGLMDVFFGTTCTAAALWGITRSKTLFGASLWPVFFNAFIGVELYLLGECPLIFGMITVALGEFLAVSCIGYVVFRQVMKNPGLMARLKLA